MTLEFQVGQGAKGQSVCGNSNNEDIKSYENILCLLYACILVQSSILGNTLRPCM